MTSLDYYNTEVNTYIGFNLIWCDFIRLLQHRGIMSILI